MWIQEYREREKLELWQFQQRVNDFIHEMPNPIEATISGALIHMLEVDKNAVTHPRIANAIATLCGATPEQRDMIVADSHKGWWIGPTQKELELVEKINGHTVSIEDNDDKAPTIEEDQSEEYTKPKRFVAYYPPHRKSVPWIGKKEVVKLDESGKVIGRFQSVKEAAKNDNVSTQMVAVRCMRRVKHEFGKSFNNSKRETDHTYRYASEWDNMSKGEQMNDISMVQKDVFK